MSSPPIQPLRPCPVTFNGRTGRLAGDDLTPLRRTWGQLEGVFADEEAWAAIDSERVAYWAELYFPVPTGTEGGLNFGNTYVEPGRVGDEYVVTKGHFHENREAAEYYWCLAGEGALLLMDEERNCRAERMTPGSLHYIPGRTAHRVANTGEETLALGACWPSNAGHDYETIAREGFSARLLCVDGEPKLVGPGAVA